MTMTPRLETSAAMVDLASAWPTGEQWVRVFTLQDHNTRVVVLGTLLLGIAAGVVGSFTLLRKRALMGDALSHATLPGIGLAFVIAVGLGMGRSLFVLLIGAVVTGALGVGTVLLLRQQTRLKEDAAMGIVLSVFFGAGVCMLTIVQQMGSGSAAGLEGFIYGKTASMVPQDVWLIAIAGGVSIVACGLLFKELRLLCFDAGYAQAQGWPTLALDVTLMAFVTAVTVVGLQAVGLILVIALLIIPAAAARFWSDRMLPMTLLAGALGGVSGAIGAAVSALAPRLPSGAMIVLVAAAVFGISMAFGPARGVVPRALRHRNLRRRVEQQHLLRAVYEWHERGGEGVAGGVPVFELVKTRSWSQSRLQRIVRRAERDDLLEFDETGLITLTDLGRDAARRVTRNHRLWEAYLIEHADVAPSHVDRDADAIEHVLDRDMIRRLESLIAPAEDLPSPHPIRTPATAGVVA
ncbi:MAG: iron chelate uptake ABC transporter family permease subunit [Planctomycetota bacterium]